MRDLTNHRNRIICKKLRSNFIPRRIQCGDPYGRMWRCANDFSFIGINNPDHIWQRSLCTKKKNGGVVANEADMDVTDAKQIRDHAMIN